jgi:hypothetical protein
VDAALVLMMLGGIVGVVLGVVVVGGLNAVRVVPTALLDCIGHHIGCTGGEAGSVWTWVKAGSVWDRRLWTGLEAGSVWTRVKPGSVWIGVTGGSVWIRVKAG